MADPWNMSVINQFYGSLSFLRGNRFICLFSGDGSIAKQCFSGTTNIGYMVREIDLPGFSMNTGLSYIGGQDSTYFDIYNSGSIRVSLFNTGPELNSFNNYFKTIYSPTTGHIAYIDDCYFTTTVLEYDETGNKRAKHNYFKCILENIGLLKYQHEQLQTFPTFDVTIKFVYQQYETF